MAYSFDSGFSSGFGRNSDMSFAVTTMTIAARRAKLVEVQQLVNELVQINELAARTYTQLTAQGESAAEIKNTLDKILAAGGDCFQSSGTDLSSFVGDTISDRIINMMGTASGGTSWVHPA